MLLNQESSRLGDEETFTIHLELGDGLEVRKIDGVLGGAIEVSTHLGLGSSNKLSLGVGLLGSLSLMVEDHVGIGGGSGELLGEGDEVALVEILGAGKELVNFGIIHVGDVEVRDVGVGELEDFEVVLEVLGGGNLGLGLNESLDDGAGHLRGDVDGGVGGSNLLGELGLGDEGSLQEREIREQSGIEEKPGESCAIGRDLSA